MMQDLFNDNLMFLAILMVLLAIIIIMLKVMKTFSKPAKIEPLQDTIIGLSEQVRILGEGQQQLTGSLRTITEAQATSQTKLVSVINERLAEVQNKMGESLQGSATKTARSLGELQQRLETIDKAQENIEKLS